LLRTRRLRGETPFPHGWKFAELGDIIVKVGDDAIDVEADLFSALEDLKPGDVVDVTVNRVVAVNDELQLKEVVLKIALQASTQVEKSMLSQLYPAQ
jgi:S1-C subfamily serine protease